ncbi:holo-ACP synthase [Intestinibacter bartlettii]|uniref:Holo-[acyl-carrier-protein] synthase n=1 Tax=Intestinibacter bartlettii TaxID=261299 RepID=A0ABS6DZ02_9FIRM|nr:holo-ACP synthase [Intestinibacter bartlettii]MBU5337080.1 holo-ACP synthase [Intestinibacter bartlettii]
MNIFGIGIDIIEIDRIENVLERNPRFLERNFTEQEINYFKQRKFKSESIAGNFAAKEAISKAIGTGIRGFKLKDIEIIRDELGKPIVNTYNNLSEICIKYNIKEIKVSISHSENYAVANSIIISKN